jgi:16S rRNA (cytosine1407-C5)-methyltransferase
MQEAASMLPPVLLDPQPGESILDMSAAPGSKTTQMAAQMQNTGVIVANDVQEKRLWTLKSALYRSGVTNTIVTKKVGQWFGKHMTERFDRVLCDAPCTAQGTARKDSDALQYCGMENIEAMARLQYGLLEAAIHATKVGGRIVYSTCTLTPEENELLVRKILNTYFDHLEIIDPMTLNFSLWEGLKNHIHDSDILQNQILNSSNSPENRGKNDALPFIRLWPHRIDVEGFFCAVLQKKARTKDPMKMESVEFQEDFVPKSRVKEAKNYLLERFGSDFLREDENLFARGEQLLVLNKTASSFPLPVEDYALGLPFARFYASGNLRVDHEIATLRGISATKNVHILSNDDLTRVLRGEDLACDPILSGDIILRWRDIAVGMGLATDGKLKNRLPRWLVQYQTGS